MQIHEVTQQQIDEGLGSMVGGIAGGLSNFGNKVVGAISPGGPAKDAYAAKVRPEQIKMLADKSLNAWRAYEKELLKSNPDARDGDMYEQALLAFVSKNLLGGQYLPNVINKDQIVALVKQLSKPGSVTEAVPTVKPITKPVGSLASRSTQRNAPATATTPATPATATTPATPATATTPATPATATTPATPATATTPSASMSPQQQKDLWLKLVQQAVIAQPRAPGGQTPSATGASTNTQSNQAAGDARSYVQQFNQSLDPTVVKGLLTFGNTANKNTGNNNVQSTGNPVADALLLMAGFRGI
jgi:hypothetical protein